MTYDRERDRPPPNPPPFDVGVVVPTVGRPTLERAVRSVFAQTFPGTVHVLVGVDRRLGDLAPLDRLAADAPARVRLTRLDLGYSTAARHGGLIPAGTGGGLRTALSYLAHARHLAYLDDDNWWHPDHLTDLLAAARGRDWAYALRWFAAADGTPLGVDRWESVGPDTGVYADRFGGFVDPSCLLVDAAACEPAFRLWSHPLAGDAAGMSTDRSVFAFLRTRPAAGTGRATAYYTLSPTDVNHPQRLAWLAGRE